MEKRIRNNVGETIIISGGFAESGNDYIQRRLVDIASISNPVDLTGSALDDDFLAAVNVLVKSPEVDCLLILVLPYSPGISAELGARISHICKTEDGSLNLGQ
jgi:acyl-CoA synthetase (NDP forming)